ncbi:MAG: hypothetical protein ACI8W1_001995 [Candidatus Azotimanducaceae bacterium]|jgi:hypothetical protein
MDEAKMLDQVDDYLSGRLAGDELDVFEEALLDNTVLQREVAVGRDMRRGLGEATDQLLEMRVPLLHKLHQIIRSTLWAYSSTAVAVVAVVWFAGILQAPTGSLIIDEIVYVEQMRSSSNQQVHMIAKKNTLLSIDAAAFAEDSFTLIITQNGSEHTKLGPLLANAEMVLNISAPPLLPGRYRLSLFNDNITSYYDLIVGVSE